MFELDRQSRETVFSIDQQILSIFQVDCTGQSMQVCSTGVDSGISGGLPTAETGTEGLSNVCLDCGAPLTRVGYCPSCVICGWGGCN